jgi:hypothetical protein
VAETIRGLLASPAFMQQIDIRRRRNIVDVKIDHVNSSPITPPRRMVSPADNSAKMKGINVSPCSWDSDMTEYPCVFGHGGQRFLLYSGDGYGRTGFGLAVLEN